MSLLAGVVSQQGISAGPGARAGIGQLVTMPLAVTPGTGITGEQVELFGIFETSATNSKNYTDEFNYLEVELVAVFTSPTAVDTTVRGFYDGSTTWKLRFMPNEVGVWTYIYLWQGSGTPHGGSNGNGNFNCVDNLIFRGPLKRASDNSWYFEDARLQQFDVRSYGAHHMLWYTDKNIANSTTITTINDRIDTYLYNRGYNFTMFNGCGHRSWQNNNIAISPETDYPRGWWGANANGSSPNPGAAFDLTVFSGFEQIIDKMRSRGIYTIMFAAFWDQTSYDGTGTTPFAAMTQAQRERLIRYFMARLGAYFNIFGMSATWEWMDKHTEAVTDSIMGFVKASDPYGRLLTIHDNSQDSFSDWLGFSMTQGGATIPGSDTLLDGNDRLAAGDQTGSGNGGVDPSFRNWPIVASEWTWITTGAGDPSGGYQASDSNWQHPNTATEMMRANWGILMAGVIPLPDWWNGWQNFGGTAGGSGTTPLALDRGEPQIRTMFNFVYRQTQYRQYSQQNSLVAGPGNEICFGLPNVEYLIYGDAGGAMTINLSSVSSGITFTVTWLNPADGETRVGTSLTGGTTGGPSPRQLGTGGTTNNPGVTSSPFGAVDSVVFLRDASLPSPLDAVDNTFADIQENSGTYDFDVLANDIYHHVPTISIISQTGPGTATIVGTGAAARIRVPTSLVASPPMDTFTAASDQALTAHVPDVGTGWTQFHLTGAAFDLQVVAASDTVRYSGTASSGGRGAGYIVAPAVSSANYQVSIAIDSTTVMANVAVETSFTLVGRYLNSSNYYFFAVWPRYSTGGWYEILKNVGNVKSQVALNSTLNATTPTVAGDVFTLEFTAGGLVRGLRNGTLIPGLSASIDGALAAAGSAGFGMGAGIDTSSSADLDLNLLLDDFTVTLL